MGMIGVSPSTKMSGLVSSFQYEEINYMVAKAMEEYASSSADVSYKDTGEHAPMGFMMAGGGFYDENASQWWDQKQPSFPSHT